MRNEWSYVKGFGAGIPGVDVGVVLLAGVVSCWVRVSQELVRSGNR